MQREIERRDISTVSICIGHKICAAVKPPRAYHLRYPYGHALGEPFNHAQQRTIVQDSLELLESASSPGVLVDGPYRWRRHRFE